MDLKCLLSALSIYATDAVDAILHRSHSFYTPKHTPFHSFDTSFIILSLKPHSNSFVTLVKKQSTSTIAYVCKDNAPLNKR